MIVRGILAGIPVLGALAGLSWAVIQAEHSSATADATRLALWRLESRASALVLAAAMQELPHTTHVSIPENQEKKAAVRKAPAATIADAARSSYEAFTSKTQAGASSSSLDYAQRQSNVAITQQALLTEANPVIQAFTVHWEAGELIGELRSATGPARQTTLDWEDWRQALMADIADLLPGASLRPADAGDELLLASLPVALVPGPLTVPLSASTQWLLVGTWLAGLGGLVAVLAAMAAAARLAERRATFVSAVTHELRTPLTALRLHGDLLADPRIADDPLRRAAPVAAIQQGATRLAHLIDNVLDYARLERRTPPQLRPVSVSDMLPILEERLPGLSIPPLPDLTLLADPHGLERILANLADNARKYGKPPYAFSVERAGRRVRLLLTDAGPGLTPEARAQLFSPFARSAEAAAGESPGVGLGLALCRRLARAHGGDLQILDAPGGGVCAIVTLRVTAAPV
jgi:signal transduction histidine kinase